MKTRLLFVTPEFPYPPVSGGCLRTLSLLKDLAHYFEVHAVTFAEKPVAAQDLAALQSFLAEVTVLPLQRHVPSGFPRYWRNLRRAVRFTPPLVDRFSEPAARSELLRRLENQQDWVWLEHLWLAPYVEHIPHSATKVLDAHNVESDYYRQLKVYARNPFERWGYRVFEHAALRIEQRFLGSFDKVLTVSPEDGRLLARHCPPEKIFIVPNAVELRTIPDGNSDSGHTLYFAGRLDYAPNQEAVSWFYRSVFPSVRARFQNVRWIIVGAHPEVLDSTMRRDPYIVLTGAVHATEPYLQSSSIVIAPLALGGGTRFKILEAWASGKAVVSTSKGAEGLAFRHGENIWIANTPQEFADAIVGLLADGSLRAHLGETGHKTVREHYSLEKLHLSMQRALGNEP